MFYIIRLLLRPAVRAIFAIFAVGGTLLPSLSGISMNTCLRLITPFLCVLLLLPALSEAKPLDGDTVSVSNTPARRIRRRALFLGDSLLASAYSHISYDTLFIHRPPGKWTVKFRVNGSRDEFETKGRRDNIPYHGRVRANPHATLSAAVSYRGLALGFSLNPSKLAGINKDNEIAVLSYGNRFGFDAAYLSSKSYRGYTRSGDTHIPISKGMVNQKIFNLNAYYAFSGRRFSFPAAFSQSYQQLRSAGSLLAGFSTEGVRTTISAQPAIGYGQVKWRIFEMGIGLGYGYNFVVKRHRHPHWLFHISVLPTTDVVLSSHITSDGHRQDLSYRFPSVIITGRAAIVYSWKNMFVGSSAILNYSGAGDTDRLHINRNRFRLRLTYGFRF